AVERLGYQPNGLARNLRTGRANVVGLCATTLSNPPAISAMEGVIQVCRAHCRHTQVTTTFWNPYEEQSQLQMFLQERVAGVISFPSGAPATCYEQLQRAGIPIVLLNRRVPGLVAPVVRHDFAGAYAEVVRFLASQGHRRIAAIVPGEAAVRAD